MKPQNPNQPGKSQGNRPGQQQPQRQQGGKGGQSGTFNPQKEQEKKW